jgi:hypothetical protein
MKLSLSHLWDSRTQTNKLFKIWRNVNHVKNKKGKIIETKPTVEMKVPSASVNMANVHVTTQSKASEKHVFKN